MSLLLIIAVVEPVPYNPRRSLRSAGPLRVLPCATGRVEVTPRRAMLRRIQPRPIRGKTDTRHGACVVRGAPPCRTARAHGHTRRAGATLGSDYGGQGPADISDRP